ncbi:MAG: Glutamate synthase (NADPH) small chain [Elusimicrobia bacterium ADurb.Bin231]|nr:MAG: Glutamate synthase (NADPH) small chain [Elusimicrobia bacterium ADurb.Bin231]
MSGINADWKKMEDKNINYCVKMPLQKPEERIKNFSEVSLGLSFESALKEAKRCLQCKNPSCVKGCPVGINIPGFIKKIADNDLLSAVSVLKQKNNLPAVCGRVCPQENQCELHCILGKKGMPISIGYLERFAADWEMTNYSKPNGISGTEKTAVSHQKENACKIAVVGAGPAGLTCAADLAKKGYRVTLYESLHLPGGVLVYGIPEFRLPKSIVEQEVNYIKSLGVIIKTNFVIGKIKTADDLFKEGNKAIFIGTGAGLPRFPGIIGENLNGVYSANELLVRVNLMKAYMFPDYDTPVRIGKKVAVIGAGNVAVDSARVSLRLGAEEVSIVYRRSAEEMPARKEEIENAREEGVKFIMLAAPVRFIGNSAGELVSMECVRMRLAEPDSSGRKRPVRIEESNFLMDVDTAIIAIGQNPNPLFIKSVSGLTTGRQGNIIINGMTCATNITGIFAGGDITTGAATVIEAMGAGKKAAIAIDEYVKSLTGGNL